MPVMTCRALTVVAAVVCSSILLCEGPAAHAGDPSPHDDGDLLVYSNEEYAKQFGEQKARAAGVQPTATTSVPTVGARDPQQPWHKVNWSVRDWDGNDIPTRHGTSDFGWLHASSKHNMRSEKSIDAPYHGTADKVTGTRAEYWGWWPPTVGKCACAPSPSQSGESGARPAPGRPTGVPWAR